MHGNRDIFGPLSVIIFTSGHFLELIFVQRANQEDV